MAVKKSELEEHRAQYCELLRAARDAEREGHYSQAIQLAIASCEYLISAVQFEAKYLDEAAAQTDGLDIVLMYCPALFDHQSLAQISESLGANKRIDRYIDGKLNDRIVDAQQRMWVAYDIWSMLANAASIRDDELVNALGERVKVGDAVLRMWEQMGIVCRSATPRGVTYALTTRLGQFVKAKCPNCGSTVRAMKSRVLESLKCPAARCGKTDLFVIIAELHEEAGRSQIP